MKFIQLQFQEAYKKPKTHSTFCSYHQKADVVITKKLIFSRKLFILQLSHRIMGSKLFFVCLKKKVHPLIKSFLKSLFSGDAGIQSNNNQVKNNQESFSKLILSLTKWVQILAITVQLCQHEKVQKLLLYLFKVKH